MVFSLQYESFLFEIGHLSHILHPYNPLALLLTTWSTSDTYWDDVNYTTSYLSLECNWTNFLTRRIIFSIYILKRDIHLISFEIEIGKVINRGKETTLQKDNNRCRLYIYMSIPHVRCIDYEMECSFNFRILTPSYYTYLVRSADT